MQDNRVRMKEEDKEMFEGYIEHVLTVGHGYVLVNVADHKIVSQKHEAGWELRNTNGVKKG